MQICDDGTLKKSDELATQNRQVRKPGYCGAIMERKRIAAIILGGLVCLFVNHAATAQWLESDGDQPVNPNSGQRINPRVSYDPATGLVSLENAGGNDFADSSDNITLQGDDTGMISLALSLADPQDIGRLIPPWIDGIAWNAPEYVDGFVELVGIGVTGRFLPVGEQPASLFQLSPGLGPEEFFASSGMVEMRMSIDFGDGRPKMFLPVGDPLLTEVFVLSDRRVSGDINDDGLRNCTDVDALATAVANDVTDLRFDLNEDGKVDRSDISQWLITAGNLNQSSAYLAGDANLDGFVDASDFNLWNNNRFSFTTGWCSGDFNADGAIDSSDFNIWNQNKFTESGAPIAVPEPASFWTLLPCLLFLQRLSRSLRI